MSRSILMQPQFQKWHATPGEGDYHNVDPWALVGSLDLDKRLTALADIYLSCDSGTRSQIRQFFDGNLERLDEMWLYVRRVSNLLTSESAAEWLRRGLAIAAIEGGRADYRDSIVSLVLLRHGAERAGINWGTYFEAALESADPGFADIVRNVIGHPQSAVEHTVRDFGPASWLDESDGT